MCFISLIWKNQEVFYFTYSRYEKIFYIIC